MSTPDPDRRTPVKSVRIIRSFYFAFVGIASLLRTRRNARIDAALGILACVIGAWFRLDRVQWSIIAFTIALVLILEGLNTASKWRSIWLRPTFIRWPNTPRILPPEWY